MIPQLLWRGLTEVDLRLTAKAGWLLGWKGMRAISAFEKRRAQGRHFPAFLFISLTNACNLRCQGCWITVTRPPQALPLETLDRVVTETKHQGATFFGLLGGEPLLHAGLFDLIGRHPDCYFQVFTNGTLITPETAKTMRRLGNVTPLISIEGRARVSDERRGGTEVYERALRGLQYCRENRLIIGVATSVCRSNIDDLVSEQFVADMIQHGVHYLWYYIYRPVGADPSPDLCLSAAEILRLRRFMVELRGRAPLVIVDAYWDHEGRALCPAATGISHHIGPAGDIEPCPPIQFACENVGDGAQLFEKIDASQFLARFRELASKTTRGCLLLDRPDLLKDFMVCEQARDTSGRGTGIQELGAMTVRPGHHLPGQEIPEKHWAYRFAKKHWFFGFGAYG